MKEHQKALIEDHFTAIRVMLRDFEVEVNKMPFKQAYDYVKPISYLMTEAVSEVIGERAKRVNDGDDLLNRITEPRSE